jgi:hypothetical protein
MMDIHIEGRFSPFQPIEIGIAECKSPLSVFFFSVRATLGSWDLGEGGE